jgi:hypothetical protein
MKRSWIKRKKPMRRKSGTFGKRTPKAENGSGNAKLIQPRTSRKTSKAFKSSSLKRSSRLRRVSPNREKVNAVYFKKKKEYLSTHTLCQVCGYSVSHDVHHIKGRGRFLCDESTFLGCCRWCHDFIENNKAWARKNGYLIYGKDGK